VPANSYHVCGDLAKNSKKSNLCKSPRHTVAGEIEHKAKRINDPSPDAYKPIDKHVTPRVLGAFNLKGALEHTSFVADA